MDKATQETLAKLHELVGAIKMAKLAGSFVDSARYSLIKQIRDSKAYKVLGKDWKEFCAEDLRSSQNTINQELKMLEDYGEPFLKAAERIGLQKRELLALGSGLSDDAKADMKKGLIKIGEYEFKLTEIEENADEFKEALNGLNKQLEETRADLKASQRVNENHHKTIEKLHKQIDKNAKRDADKELSEEEEEFIGQMEKLRTGFDGYMLKVEPAKMTELSLETATARMKSAYLTSIIYMKQQLLAAEAAAVEMFGDPAMNPEEKWAPGKK